MTIREGGMLLRLTTLVLAANLLVGTARAMPLDTDTARKSLEQIHTYSVLVDVSDDLEKAGLDETAIQTDVELKLRQAGIQIWDATTDHAGLSASLVLTVDGISATDGIQYGITMDIAVRQLVVMPKRRPTKTKKGREWQNEIFPAETWRVSSVGLFGREKVRTLREGARDLVDRFLNAYLTANPKTASE